MSDDAVLEGFPFSTKHITGSLRTYETFLLDQTPPASSTESSVRSLPGSPGPLIIQPGSSFLGCKDLEHQYLLRPRDDPDEEPLDPARCEKVMKRMHELISIAAIGGFLSGYSAGVFSGALLPLTRVFGLETWQEESIVFATVLFAFLASLMGSSLNERFGRRPIIMLAAAVFALGGLIMAAAQCFWMLVLGQVMLGVGIGMESLTSPLYIAEVAKPSLRGMLVSEYALFICFGQFSAGIVDGIFGAFEGGWRFMFGFACVPAVVLLFGFATLPESPTWLYARGRHSEAGKVLSTVRDSYQEVKVELMGIHDSIRQSKGLTREEYMFNGTSSNSTSSSSESLASILRTPSTRRALLVGCSLMVLQQFCGANVVMYYSATIYRMSGFSELTAIWLSAFTALAQLIGLGISVKLVERVGRRPLVLTSFPLVAVCLVGMGASFYLARVTSEPMLEVATISAAGRCLSQPALVWDGVTRYCYDCALIEGCGFCGGTCVPGTADGPLDQSQCPSEGNWEYDMCSTPPIGRSLPLLLFGGIGLCTNVLNFPLFSKLVAGHLDGTLSPSLWNWRSGSSLDNKQRNLSCSAPVTGSEHLHWYQLVL
jgi:SP family myo-inositol transporter-like MFS transporter 13